MAVKHFLFIRHGKTQSNLERRYVGDPSEPLCAIGIREAKALAYSGILPPVDFLLSGPALRCRQTTEILFPGITPEICPLAETDFGIFKGKNADDLLSDKDYEAWLETNCMGDIPGGDSVTAFKIRCCKIFERITEVSGIGTTAIVMHGGNIMAIMEQYALPRQDFYAYHIPNCGFILCRWEDRELFVEKKGGS